MLLSLIMMADLAKKAEQVALAYGPAFTKAIKEGDQSTFQEYVVLAARTGPQCVVPLKITFLFFSIHSLFVADEPVSVILQNAKGEELHFTVGNQPDATLRWLEFYQVSSEDLKEQDYLKTESLCLGVLGDRMILENARFNNAGDVYLEAYSLVTLNNTGKIIMVESFSNVNASTLVGAAENE